MGGIVALYWMIVFALVVLPTGCPGRAALAASVLTAVSYILVHFLLLATSIGRTNAKKLHETDSESDDSQRG